MKNTRFVFILYIISTLLIFSSCRKEIYDPEALGRDYFIQNIPENFDWSTTTSISLEVVPDDRYNGQYDYTIEVFDKNPLLEQNAALYSIGWGNAQNPFHKDIILPDADTVLYIRQTSPGRRKSVKKIIIDDNQLSCDFGQTAVRSSSLTAKITKAAQPDVPENFPANAIEIKGEADIKLEAGHSYVIKENYSGSIDFAGSSPLYIAGTWNNPSESIRLESGSNIHILGNGKLLCSKPCQLTWNSGATVTIAHNGQLGHEGTNNISIEFNNPSSLINNGSLYCDNIHLVSPGTQIVNRGKFYANKIGGQSIAYTFQNECYTYIQNVDFYQGTLDISPECAFVCENLRICKTPISLGNGAMLKANKVVISDWGTNTITGTGNKYALVHIGELVPGWNPPIGFYSNLSIRFDKMPSSGFELKDKKCTLEDASSGPGLEIKPSECSQGNSYIPEQPEKSEFPKSVTYNQTFTYASEDNYPSPGDYDMNDMVISMDSVTYYYTQKDEVAQMTWHITLRAVGATRQLGAAIQLDKTKPDEIKNVSYSKTLPLGVFTLNINGTEKNQTQAVIPLFDNAHQILGSSKTTTIINTISNNTEYIHDVNPVTFDITIEFVSSVKDNDLSLEDFNYFTIVGNKGQDRVEIHLPKYKHTNLSSAPESMQKVTDNFMWTIKIPGIFKYSHEWVRITNSYLRFENWVHSNRKEDREWYNYPVLEKLYRE